MIVRRISALFAAVLLGTVSTQASEGWLTRYEEALAAAKQQDRLILVNFTGSDWCPPCIKFKNEVLSAEAFQQHAQAGLVLLELDFPRRTQLPEEQRAHNQELAKRFDVEAFPTVLLLDSEGKVLDRMVGFPRGGLDGFLKFVSRKAAK